MAQGSKVSCRFAVPIGQVLRHSIECFCAPYFALRQRSEGFNLSAVGHLVIKAFCLSCGIVTDKREPEALHLPQYGISATFFVLGKQMFSLIIGKNDGKGNP